MNLFFDNPIARKWYKLDDSVKYMIWVITFALMLMTGIGGLLMAESIFGSEFVIEHTPLAIISFVVFFFFVIGFLTITWPNNKKQFLKDLDNK
jgi:predicted tellurium resistance membrane protein TerC